MTDLAETFARRRRLIDVVAACRMDKNATCPNHPNHAAIMLTMSAQHDIKVFKFDPLTALAIHKSKIDNVPQTASLFNSSLLLCNIGVVKELLYMKDSKGFQMISCVFDDGYNLTSKFKLAPGSKIEFNTIQFLNEDEPMKNVVGASLPDYIEALKFLFRFMAIYDVEKTPIVMHPETFKIKNHYAKQYGVNKNLFTYNTIYLNERVVRTYNEICRTRSWEGEYVSEPTLISPHFRQLANGKTIFIAPHFRGVLKNRNKLKITTVRGEV